MKNISTLTIGFSLVVLTWLSVTIDTANPDSVSPLRRTDDILRSRAAFAVVNEEIARGLNLHTLSESDYWKLRGPVLLEPQTEIHFQLREQFDRIVNTVDFGASLDAGSPSQNLPVRQGNTPVLYQKASEIIRDFIARRYISVIVMSNAPIGMGEMTAIRGLQGEVRYTYDIINGACVFVPLKNLASLIKRPFITEVWPDDKGNLELSGSLQQIGAQNVHDAPPDGLGVTGKGVTVAVVDTGIDCFHPALKNRVVDARGQTNIWNFNDCRDPDEVDSDHGTHVAGIIGANGSLIGVAPEVNLLDAKSKYLLLGFVPSNVDDIVTDWLGGPVPNYSDATEAIEWAVRVKADVINMSMGHDPWKYGRRGEDPMSTLIDKVVGDGVVFVKSAGNEIGRRTSGKFNALPANKAIQHEFKTRKATEIEVTLIWDNGSNDLDLAILDLKGNELCESRKHDGTFPWNNPWIGNTDYETVYEQVVCGVTAGETYIVQVEGYAGSGAQKYEVWLRGTKVNDFNTSPRRQPIFTPGHADDAQTVNVPGYSEKAITVGAVDDSGNAIANYSSQGPSDTDLIKPEVVAPGTVFSTIPRGGTGKKNGTSMAAPHVAGVAALILDAVGKNEAGDWNFNPNEVKSAIVRGAEYIWGVILSNDGAGLVKADNVIFGGVVNPGQKLYFKIDPRLTKYEYNTYFLNAENVFSQGPDFVVPLSVPLAVAISWEGNGSDLELEFLYKNGKSLPHKPEQGSNYRKIIAQLHTGLGPSDFFYLNVIHNNPAGNPISFTGAATHPIMLKLDVNGDGVVNLKDLVEVAKKLKEVGVHIEDINGDGVVDLDDMAIIAKEIAGAPAAPTGSQVAIETIKQWLAEAKRMGDTDPDFLQGIAMLEQLLALLTPIETALLANYPNPFNPETWIPYQLANPTRVTLTIYDIQGRAVRDLDLGHQRAGIYQSRARAAHWDGRNAQGESVASGVYFYTLTAGDFTATRKMLIRK